MPVSIDYNQMGQMYFNLFTVSLHDNIVPRLVQSSHSDVRIKTSSSHELEKRSLVFLHDLASFAWLVLKSKQSHSRKPFLYQCPCSYSSEAITRASQAFKKQ